VLREMRHDTVGCAGPHVNHYANGDIAGLMRRLGQRTIELFSPPALVPHGHRSGRRKERCDKDDDCGFSHAGLNSNSNAESVAL
jgi:hypothetical protein